MFFALHHVLIWVLPFALSFALLLSPSFSLSWHFSPSLFFKVFILFFCRSVIFAVTHWFRYCQCFAITRSLPFQLPIVFSFILFFHRMSCLCGFVFYFAFSFSPFFYFLSYLQRYIHLLILILNIQYYKEFNYLKIFKKSSCCD